MNLKVDDISLNGENDDYQINVKTNELHIIIDVIGNRASKFPKLRVKAQEKGFFSSDYNEEMAVEIIKETSLSLWKPPVTLIIKSVHRFIHTFSFLLSPVSSASFLEILSAFHQTLADQKRVRPQFFQILNVIGRMNPAFTNQKVVFEPFAPFLSNGAKYPDRFSRFLNPDC